MLEFLRGRAKHDFVDIHVKRLLDRVSDGACYRISRNLICAIEFAYRLYRVWVGAALLQFGFHGARRDNGGANACTRFGTQAFG